MVMQQRRRRIPVRYGEGDSRFFFGERCLYMLAIVDDKEIDELYAEIPFSELRYIREVEGNRRFDPYEELRWTITEECEAGGMDPDLLAFE